MKKDVLLKQVTTLGDDRLSSVDLWEHITCCQTFPWAGFHLLYPSVLLNLRCLRSWSFCLLVPAVSCGATLRPEAGCTLCSPPSTHWVLSSSSRPVTSWVLASTCLERRSITGNGVSASLSPTVHRDTSLLPVLRSPPKPKESLVQARRHCQVPLL